MLTIARIAFTLGWNIERRIGRKVLVRFLRAWRVRYSVDCDCKPFTDCVKCWYETSTFANVRIQGSK